MRITEKCVFLAAVLSLAGNLIAQPPSEPAEPSGGQPAKAAEESPQVPEQDDKTTPSGDANPAESKPGQSKPQEEAIKPRDYYVSPRSYGSKPEPDPPPYVKTIDHLGLGLENMKWLQFGIEQRTRFEYRDDDYRKAPLQPLRSPFVHDEPFLMRNRIFLGITDIVDPFRAAIEFQDSRMFNSMFPDTTSDVDENEIIQAYGELYFKDALGKGEPIRLRVGRMTLDLVDRWLMARNTFGNTVFSWDGARLTLGDLNSLWQVDVFAAEVDERRVHQWDRPDEQTWMYGITGDWRGWSKWVTLEPYYFVRDEDRKGYTTPDRTIHTVGLRAYNAFGKSGWDYDADVAFQFGDDGRNNQRAFAARTDVGYLFDHPWKPRVSMCAAYATGDNNPNDRTSGRFDKLYGTFDAMSSEGIFTWQNIIAPKLRFEFQPLKSVRLNAAYGGYWLDHNRDGWVAVNRQDPTGRAGNFIGQELECRVRWQIDPRMELTAGYYHFMQGNFVDKTGRADDSDYFFVQTVVSLYK
ncbi:MAG: alginate export family protein [Planctomycetes bacterium]|nr:alginate export family protein [Planctomycetota bacterium]MBI3834855.1 alginate export family protein [Planctomycetota bacterium]